VPGREGAHSVHVAVGDKVLNDPERDPDDLLDTEPVTQFAFDVGPGHAGIAVGIQQALLGGDQRSLAVHGDRPALQHHRRSDPVNPQVIEDESAAGFRFPLDPEPVAPRVEGKVDARPPAVIIDHDERSRVPDPGGVVGDFDEVHTAGQGATGVLHLAGVCQHRE